MMSRPWSLLRPSRATLVVVALVGALGFRLYTLHFVYWPPGFDAWAYLHRAATIWPGTDAATYLTETFRTWNGQTFGVTDYLYPPPLALLLSPLTAFPAPFALGGWMFVVGGGMVGLMVLLRPLVGSRVAVASVALFPPVWNTVWLGQVNGWVACSWMLAILAAQRGTMAWAGGWLSGGALLKITPSVGLALLAARRHWAAVGAAAGTAVGVGLMTLGVVGPAAWLEGVTSALLRTSNPPNLVSVTSLLYRLPGAVGTVAQGTVIAGAVAVSLWRARRVSVSMALAGGIFLTLALARFTWAHHFVAALPALAVLWARGGRSRWGAVGLWGASGFAPFAVLPLVSVAGWIVCFWPTLAGIDACDAPDGAPSADTETDSHPSESEAQGQEA